MNIEELYKLWSEDPYFDEQTRKELLAIRDDKKEIEERFYRDLEFGTAGLRGILGAGTNRMNMYIVSRASAGLGKYIVSEGEEAMKRGVVISYDSRHYSPEFAEITEGVKARMQAWNERELLTRPGKDVKGIIFNLQQNYGYGGEKHEMELSGGALEAWMRGETDG